MRTKYLLAGIAASTLLATAALAQSSPPPAPAPAATATKTAPVQVSGQWRASKLIGLNVYNNNNEKIGDINEILVTSDGKISGVIIGAGGFLGMGEHDVLVKLDQLKFVNEPVRTSATTTTTTTTTRSAPAPTTGSGSATVPARPARVANEKWYPDHAMMNATKDQLKAMPQFKYN
ncbi:MAG TPA: PRC-barrel domain-containing protein [Mesorhizobium sp.]|nr:PRC-barrel domain-containing protein [Mesorhizobium sp.]